MLDTLTIDTFSRLHGQQFQLVLDDGSRTALTLTEVQAVGGGAGGARTPFSLVFRAPPALRVPQAIYRLESEALAPLELFLVPIGVDPQGTLYQAVFT